MKTEQKIQVKEAVARYVAAFGNISEAVITLCNVNEVVIEHIIEGRLEEVDDFSWHQLARQVGFYCGDWQVADTSAYMLLSILLGDAQRYAKAYGIAIDRGLGKTFTAGQYLKTRKNVIYLACRAHMNRRAFVSELLETVATSPSASMPGMISAFVMAITEKDEALLVLDDAHSLKDRVLNLVATLAHGLAGKVGVVLLGTDVLRQRIIAGAAAQKQGFGELYQLFGNRFITLSRPNRNDAALICQANGQEDQGIIDLISTECTDGFHKITNLIHQYRELKAAA